MHRTVVIEREVHGITHVVRCIHHVAGLRNDHSAGILAFKGGLEVLPGSLDIVGVIHVSLSISTNRPFPKNLEDTEGICVVVLAFTRCIENLLPHRPILLTVVLLDRVITNHVIQWDAVVVHHLLETSLQFLLAFHPLLVLPIELANFFQFLPLFYRHE